MTTPTPDRQPLWKALDKAYGVATTNNCNYRQAYAALIREFRDYWLPEEPEEEPYLATDLGWMVNSDKAIRWAERQSLRAELTAEVERAERGDD